MRLLLATVVTLVLLGCYEDSTGCLDPDADNYDLLADQACVDCCTFPALSVRVSSVWQDTAVVVGRTYTDGFGHAFQFVRFRYYLGDLRLTSADAALADPSRTVALVAADNSPLSLNGNYLLASLTTTTTPVGTLRTGSSTLTGLSGTYGLADRYRTVAPTLAPTGDALRTQPGRLNFNDGRGYVQARLEYTRSPGGDTLSVSTYGSLPFLLDFGQGVTPARGFDLRVDVQARLDLLLGSVDLSADSTTVAEALGRAADFFVATGLAQ